MPHTMKKKALPSELPWKKYEALKFSNTFPMEKLFNYNALKLMCWYKARQVLHPNASSIINNLVHKNYGEHKTWISISLLLLFQVLGKAIPSTYVTSLSMNLSN